MNNRRIGLIMTFMAVSFVSQPMTVLAENGKTPPAEQKTEKNSSNELICRMVKSKGSNIKRKECKTRAERSIDATRSRETMEEMRRSPTATGN